MKHTEFDLFCTDSNCETCKYSECITVEECERSFNRDRTNSSIQFKDKTIALVSEKLVGDLIVLYGERDKYMDTSISYDDMTNRIHEKIKEIDKSKIVMSLSVVGDSND